MFWEIILPIFRSTRLCYSFWLLATGRQHRGCIIPKAVTQSSAPENGQNNCPKHVELIGIINKLLLLHLVGCLYYLFQWCRVKQISNLHICPITETKAKEKKILHPAQVYKRQLGVNVLFRLFLYFNNLKCALLFLMKIIWKQSVF